MADFIFIIPKIKKRRDGAVPPPFAFLKLAAVLEKENYTSTLIDARIDPHYLQNIKHELDAKPLFVGITSMTGFQTIEGLKITKFIKKANPQIPVVWGGVHASLLPDELLKDEHIDVAVIGEGELTIASLAEKYKSKNILLDDIEGIAFRKNNSIKKNPDREFLDLNSLPMPAWGLIRDKIDYYSTDNGKTLNIITSAGCPHDCYFCYNMSYNRSKFRARSAENVVDEIAYLHKEFGIKKIGFTDDNLMVNRKRVFDICEGLRKRKIALEMQCDIRSDYINDELMSYLTANGFKKFLLGVESGSQRMLELVNKRTTIENMKKGISILNKHTDGGHLYSLMIGLPKETKQDIYETWKLAQWIYSIDRKADITLNIYTPYPGVRLTNMLAENGYSIPKTNFEWIKYNLFSIDNKNWIQEKRLVRSLVNIVRLSFAPCHGNSLKRFLSEYAKRRFLSNQLRSYPEFEMLHYLLRHI